MGGLFSRPKTDQARVTVKAFYIVGTAEERLAKCLELMAENPHLTCRIINANENYSATALQLSDMHFPGDFHDIIKRAEASQANGEDSLIRLSIPRI